MWFPAEAGGPTGGGPAVTSRPCPFDRSQLVVSVLVSFAGVRDSPWTWSRAPDQRWRTCQNAPGRSTEALKSGRSVVRPRPCPPALRRADKTPTSANAVGVLLSVAIYVPLGRWRPPYSSC